VVLLETFSPAARSNSALLRNLAQIVVNTALPSHIKATSPRTYGATVSGGCNGRSSARQRVSKIRHTYGQSRGNWTGREWRPVGPPSASGRAHPPWRARSRARVADQRVESRPAVARGRSSPPEPHGRAGWVRSWSSG